MRSSRPAGSPSLSAVFRRWAGLLFLFIFFLGAHSVKAAEGGGSASSLSGRKTYTEAGGEGEKVLELSAGAGSVFGKDELLLKGYVDIRYGDLRLQADTVRYVPATKDCFAEGNVVLDSGSTRLTAQRVEYNLGTETGSFYQARGYAEPSFYFEAAEVRKLDKDRYTIRDASFTTCTQPVPYWSFKVARGTIHLENYAYLHHVSFKAEHVPIFYSPYLVWPIKEDRATGLLFPEFGYSRTRGFVLSNAFYWAIRRNMDATFFLDYYAKAGLGEGLEYRYVPTAGGKGQFTGAYIHDQVVDRDRYSFNLNHRQDLPHDYRLVASLNNVSDFDYYLDFQRDLRVSSNPVILSFAYLTRNWSNYAFNVRTERRRQLFNISQTLFPGFPIDPSDTQCTVNSITRQCEVAFTNLIEPSVEWRGSRQRLGNSPLYFAFETSADNFQKSTELFTTTYQRFDLFPSFSAPLRLAPWLDVNPTIGLRDTYYSRRLGSRVSEDANLNGVADPGEDVGLDGIPGTGDAGEGNLILDRRQEILNQDFVRKILSGSLEIIGPKISRVYLTPDSRFSPALKHTFEPRVFYLYQSKVDNPGEIIPFDEKDLLSGNSNSVAYSLTTRLFAKRPGTTPTGNPGGTSIFTPGRSAAPAPPEGQEFSAPASPPKEEAPVLSPVEIASFSLAQRYSFLGPLSTRGTCFFVNGDPQGPDCVTTNLSGVDASVRFNPTLFTTLDAKANYDILRNEVGSGNVSAHYRNPDWGFVDFSWFFQKPLETTAAKSSQLGLQAQTIILNRRLLLGFQGHYDLVENQLQDQRYTLGYNTQCCGFTFELLDRSFTTVSQQEFRLMVNLKGIGNVLDLNSGSSSIPGAPINF
ncbi:MAG TPA: LPS assembly protein LptD [Candidatus Polarisedimenticolia bacterium]|nr:LPS assembly protein LptD [Candidatus Polarisedimenticolia bacterium]